MLTGPTVIAQRYEILGIIGGSRQRGDGRFVAMQRAVVQRVEEILEDPGLP